MSTPDALKNWEPRDFVSKVQNQALTAFIAAYQTTFFLLVLLDDLNSELAAGLIQSPAGRREGDGIGFRTSLQDVDATVISKQLKSAEGDIVGRYAGNGPRPVPSRIPQALLREPCYVAPIRKRGEASLVNKISVGRARNNDIVLRHTSVSKFHAWFQIQEITRLFVKDSESRNHTYIDGKMIEDLTEIKPGQSIMFGMVEGRICSAESIWHALQY
jgi:hypothetical protein